MLKIRIHIDLADLDPDPDWECGSGSGSRSMEIDQNYQINLVSCLSNRLWYLRRYVIWPITYYILKEYFHVKSELFRNLHLTRIRPNPHWFGSMDPHPHWDKKLDPDPDLNQCGSTTLTMDIEYATHVSRFMAKQDVGPNILVPYNLNTCSNAERYCTL